MQPPVATMGSLEDCLAGDSQTDELEQEARMSSEDSGEPQTQAAMAKGASSKELHIFHLSCAQTEEATLPTGHK